MRIGWIMALALSMPMQVLAVQALAAPQPPAGNAKMGAALAQENCGACHATGLHGTSPNRLAPPFRRIASQWPPEYLQESLAEGIMTGHPGMPEFTFSPKQIDDLIAHLARLRKR